MFDELDCVLTLISCTSSLFQLWLSLTLSLAMAWVARSLSALWTFYICSGSFLLSYFFLHRNVTRKKVNTSSLLVVKYIGDETTSHLVVDTVSHRSKTLLELVLQTPLTGEARIQKKISNLSAGDERNVWNIYLKATVVVVVTPCLAVSILSVVEKSKGHSLLVSLLFSV